MADEENEFRRCFGARTERWMLTMFTCEYDRWLGGNVKHSGRRTGREEGVIRNSRSDGPGDRTPYGMVDRSLGTAGSS